MARMRTESDFGLRGLQSAKFGQAGHGLAPRSIASWALRWQGTNI